MKSKTFGKIFALMVVSVFLMHTSAHAGWNPKGWVKGKRKGWQGESTPPGLSDKELKHKGKEAKKEAKKAEKEARKEAKEKASG